MQMISTIESPVPHYSGFSSKLADCLTGSKNKTRSNWTVEQLNIEPYQHILEVGYGTGNTLLDVGKKMRSGFLAGTDESPDMYQIATRKNKKIIQNKLLQLHVGSAADLPYPSHYFHTVYGNNSHLSWKEPQYVFMQLGRLLKTGGKLVMVFQPRHAKTDNELWQAAEDVQQQYLEAGLTDIRVSFRDMEPVNAIAVVGFKA